MENNENTWQLNSFRFDDEPLGDEPLGYLIISSFEMRGPKDVDVFAEHKVAYCDFVLKPKPESEHRFLEYNWIPTNTKNAELEAKIRAFIEITNYRIDGLDPKQIDHLINSIDAPVIEILSDGPTTFPPATTTFPPTTTSSPGDILAYCCLDGENVGFMPISECVGMGGSSSATGDDCTTPPPSTTSTTTSAPTTTTTTTEDPEDFCPVCMELETIPVKWYFHNTESPYELQATYTGTATYSYHDGFYCRYVIPAGGSWADAGELLVHDNSGTIRISGGAGSGFNSEWVNVGTCPDGSDEIVLPAESTWHPSYWVLWESPPTTTTTLPPTTTTTAAPTTTTTTTLPPTTTTTAAPTTTLPPTTTTTAAPTTTTTPPPLPTGYFSHPPAELPEAIKVKATRIWDASKNYTDRVVGETLTPNGTPSIVTGKTGGAYSFPASTNSYLSVTRDNAAWLPTSGTISFWWYIDLTANSGWGLANGVTAIDFGGNGQTLIRRDGNTHRLNLRNQTGGSSVGHLSPNGSMPTVTGWNHIVMQWAGSTVYWWINGTKYTATTTFTGFDTSIMTANSRIGSTAVLTNQSVEQLMLFSEVLSDSEVAEIYNAGLGVMVRSQQLLKGSAGVKVHRFISMSGGVLVGGEADIIVGYRQTMSGGLTLSGTATVKVNRFIEMTGGVKVGGSADVYQIVRKYIFILPDKVNRDFHRFPFLITMPFPPEAVLDGFKVLDMEENELLIDLRERKEDSLSFVVKTPVSMEGNQLEVRYYE